MLRAGPGADPLAALRMAEASQLSDAATDESVGE